MATVAYSQSLSFQPLSFHRGLGFRQTIRFSTAPSLNIHSCWQVHFMGTSLPTLVVSHAAIRSPLCGSVKTCASQAGPGKCSGGCWPRHTQCWLNLLDQPSCNHAPQSAAHPVLLCRSLPSPNTAYAYTYHPKSIHLNLSHHCCHPTQPFHSIHSSTVEHSSSPSTRSCIHTRVYTALHDS